MSRNDAIVTRLVSSSSPVVAVDSVVEHESLGLVQRLHGVCVVDDVLNVQHGTPLLLFGVSRLLWQNTLFCCLLLLLLLLLQLLQSPSVLLGKDFVEVSARGGPFVCKHTQNTLCDLTPEAAYLNLQHPLTKQQ